MNIFKQLISGSTLAICGFSVLAAPEFSKTLSKNTLNEIGMVQAIPSSKFLGDTSTTKKGFKLFFGQKEDNSEWINKAYFHIKDKCSSLPNKPKSLDELNAGFKVFISSISETAAANADIISMASVTGKKEAFVEILQYAQYAERQCKTDYGTYPVNFGVGAQTNLHIKKIDSSLKTNNIPMIAASVQYGKSQVTINITTLGLTGKKIDSAIPTYSNGLGSFDVANYGKMTSTVDQIRVLAYDKDVIVSPQLIITEKVIESVAREIKKKNK